MNGLGLLAMAVIRMNLIVQGDPQAPEPPPSPTGEPPLAYYPNAARLQGIEGYGIAQCKIDLETRALQNCRIVGEKPTRQGFGETAKMIAEMTRPTELQIKKGQAAGGRGASVEAMVAVFFRVRTKTGDAALPPAAEAQSN